MPDLLLLVALPWSGHARMLAGDIATAATRAAKADPGDRTDVAGYERLCSQLELLAWEAVTGGASQVSLSEPPAAPALPVAAHDLSDPLGPGLLAQVPAPAAEVARQWLADGNLVVTVTVPFQPGEDLVRPVAAGAPEVASRWQAPNGEDGARAVEARFRAQLAAAVGGTRREAVRPSGVQNRVLTKVLHEYVAGTPDTRVDVPVAYRDGSTATHLFPLRCLPFVSTVPSGADAELHVALLSLRHTEMDAVIDGAWLRNAEVSRPRPASQTDDFVYETSLRQLDALTDSGRRTALLHLYQTGLDAAIVGFYRAVTVHLLAHPGSLSIVPMFAAVSRSASAEPTRFRPGQHWTTGERA